jgi:anthranilate phosphoribosyltransferase
VRRTVLNVLEKLVSPIFGSRLAVGITHRPFLKSVSEALVGLGVEHALVFQAIEGSDEAPLDGNSSFIRVRNGKAEELRVPPESLGLTRTTRAHIPWKDPEEESHQVLATLGGAGGPVRDLILFNAALRLWVADEDTPLGDQVEKADDALRSGAALGLLDGLRQPTPIV